MKVNNIKENQKIETIQISTNIYLKFYRFVPLNFTNIGARKSIITNCAQISL